MKKLALRVALMPLACSSLYLASTNAAADDLSISVSTDYVSEYVFRGVTLAGEAIQPGVELNYGKFTLGAWASVAVGEESVFFGDEIDLYAGYGFDLNDKISASVGVTVYHYPQAGGLFDVGGSDASMVEPYGSLSFDMPLSPSITAFYDFNLETFTLNGTAEHSFPLGEKTSFDLGANIWIVSADNGTNYQSGILSGAVSYTFTETTSAYIGVNGGLNSEDTFADINFNPANLFATKSANKSSSVWFGVGISSGF